MGYWTKILFLCLYFIKNIIELNNERDTLRERLWIPEVINQHKGDVSPILERIDSVTAEMSMEIDCLENAKEYEQYRTIEDVIYDEMELWSQTLSDAQVEALAKSIINRLS